MGTVQHIAMSMLAMSSVALSGCSGAPLLPFELQNSSSAINSDFELTIGKTSKTEIFAALGSPEHHLNDRYSVNRIFRKNGDLPITFLSRDGKQQSVSPGDGPTQFVLLIEYDQTGIAIDYQVEKARTDVFGSPHMFRELSDWDAEPVDSGMTLLAVPSNKRDPPYGLVFESLRLSADGGMLAAAGSDSGLTKTWSPEYQVWIKNLQTEQTRLITLPRCRNAVLAPDLSRVACLDIDIRIFELTNGEEVSRYAGHTRFMKLQTIPVLAFSPTTEVVASGNNQGELRIWNSRTGADIRAIQTEHGPIRSVAWSDDGSLLATSNGKDRTELWDPESGDFLGEIVGSGGLVEFSAQGEMIGIVRGTHVEGWEFRLDQVGDQISVAFELSFAFLMPIMSSDSFLYWRSIDFLPNFNLVAASNGGLILFDYHHNEVIQRLGIGSAYERVIAIEANPERSFFAVGSVRRVFAWPVGITGAN